MVLGMMVLLDGVVLPFVVGNDEGPPAEAAVVS